MKNQNVVLAINKNGQKITINNLKEWIKKNNQKELADFFLIDFTLVI